jgi:hypothetical protein
MIMIIDDNVMILIIVIIFTTTITALVMTNGNDTTVRTEKKTRMSGDGRRFPVLSAEPKPTGQAIRAGISCP